MYQVELVRAAFTRFSPGSLELTVSCEPVYSGISIPVGDVQVTPCGRHYLCWVVKGTGSPRHQLARHFAASVRMNTSFPNHLQRFAIQCKSQANRVLTISYINYVVFDENTMGIGDCAEAL